MNWRERIADHYANRVLHSTITGRPEYRPPAEALRLAETEAALGAILPESLKSLLMQSDGVMDMMSINGDEWFESMWLVWTVEELAKQNRYHRASRENLVSSRDFLHLLFFAGAGADGILFAFVVEGGSCLPQVMAWHPITCEINEVAPSLDEFLKGWLTGTITV